MRRSERLQILGYEPPDQSDWVTGLHPTDDLLQGERLPHIWCQGYGLGTALTTFIAALKWLEENRDWDLDKVAVVSGIGCTGRIAGYIRLDSFHTTWIRSSLPPSSCSGCILSQGALPPDRVHRKQ